MPLVKLKKINFYKDFSEKGEVPLFYESIFNQTNSQSVFNSKNVFNEISQKGIAVVHLIPPYFDLHLNGNFKAVDVKTHNGYLADFRDFDTFNSYLLEHFNSNGRKLLKRRLSRLEKCFNIEYKVYYGQTIEKDHYQFLFGEFKNMIEARFSQRGQKSNSLGNWSFYLESCFDKILHKEASLFVVYNNKKPIAISLNFLHQNIFTSAIDSYDIDFSKFGLGNILIMKKMEWCFENTFSIFNMGYGDLKYKADWCNSIYKFRTQVVFLKNNFLHRAVAQLLGWSIVFKIKHKKKFLSWKKGPRYVLRPTGYSQDLNFQVIEEKEYDNLSANSQVQKVDICVENNSFLRKPVYDFQYKTSETSEDIEVLAVGEDVYLISGKTTYGILKIPKSD